MAIADRRLALISDSGRKGLSIVDTVVPWWAIRINLKFSSTVIRGSQLKEKRSLFYLEQISSWTFHLCILFEVEHIVESRTGSALNIYNIQ